MELDRSGAGRRNLLLASLPAKDFALLEPHLKDIVLERGAVLQEQGDRIDQVYFPHEGIISLLTVTRQGDAIETATIGCEGAVGAFAGLRAAACARARRRSSEGIILAYRRVALPQGCRGERCRLQSPRALWRDVADPSPANRRMQRLASGRGAAEPLAVAGARPGRRRYPQTYPRVFVADARRAPHHCDGGRQYAAASRAHPLSPRAHRDHGPQGLEGRACECYEAIRRHVEEIAPAAGR